MTVKHSDRLEDQPLLQADPVAAMELKHDGIEGSRRVGRRGSRSPVRASQAREDGPAEQGFRLAKNRSESVLTAAPSSGTSTDRSGSGSGSGHSSGKEGGSSSDSGGDVESVSTSFPSRDIVVENFREVLTTPSAIPWQWQARRYYPLLLPFGLVLCTMMAAPVAYLLAVDLRQKGDWSGLQPLEGAASVLIVFLFTVGSIFTVLTYVYHWYRLAGAEAAPRLPVTDPLQHVVIVCAYKEPLEVLSRTFSSLAAQTGLYRKPMVVLAAESRDTTWRDSFHALKKEVGDRLRMMHTEHVLFENEAAGKSSNENWAAREVYRQLVEEQGMDPFRVVLTIVDADSYLSHSYLAHVEASYRSQPDGRRLVYNGPLNVYRNFASGNLLVQCLELVRCHQDTFHNFFTVPYPYSNYSITLGFAAEIGFWTPDNMPEDIHTVNKAMVNSFGSRTTVSIPAIICNDLVETIADRYEQAKRHQWGSVSELAWLIALLKDMGLDFPSWWAVCASECARAGSYVSTLTCLVAVFAEVALVVLLHRHWTDLPPRLKPLLAMGGAYVAWQWICFWIAELTMWRTQLKQFPIERPSIFRWVLIVLVMPVASTVNKLIFLILPTLHAVYHATFRGELAYVRAPKGPTSSSNDP